MSVKVPCRFEDLLTVLSTGLSLKELLEMKKTVLPVPLAEAHHIQVLPAVPTAEPAANSDNGQQIRKTLSLLNIQALQYNVVNRLPLNIRPVTCILQILFFWKGIVMPYHKKRFLSYTIVILCFLTAYTCRLIHTNNSLIQALVDQSRTSIYLGMYCAWVIYLNKHVVYKRMRQCLTVIGCLMVFWFFLRTVNTIFFRILLAHTFVGICIIFQ